MKTIISSTPHSLDPQEHTVAVAILRETHVEVRAELGNSDTVKCSLRRERAKTMPKNPASLRDLTLDEEWTITGDQEQFLIQDSKVHYSDSILVTLERGTRTNNICEEWNNAFAKLVGHAHPTIWRVSDSIPRDQAHVNNSLLHDMRGEAPAMPVIRHTGKFQSKLQKLCTDRRDNNKTVPDLLMGITRQYK